MGPIGSLFAIALRRVALGTVSAVALVAMATPALDELPAQAAGPPAQPQLTEFDVPGANHAFSSVCQNAFLGSLGPAGCGTTALANNDPGEVVGTYTDAELTQHAFLRAPTGDITSFEAPGQGGGPGQGTVAYSINDAGLIAGRLPGRQRRVPRFPALPERLLRAVRCPGRRYGRRAGDTRL